MLNEVTFLGEKKRINDGMEMTLNCGKNHQMTFILRITCVQLHVICSLSAYLMQYNRTELYFNVFDYIPDEETSGNDTLAVSKQVNLY